MFCLGAENDYSKELFGVDWSEGRIGWSNVGHEMQSTVSVIVEAYMGNIERVDKRITSNLESCRAETMIAE